jgi:hypothetical protein
MVKGVAVLVEDEQTEEIIARVAALDIGKAEVMCCVRVLYRSRTLQVPLTGSLRKVTIRHDRRSCVFDSST